MVIVPLPSLVDSSPKRCNMLQIIRNFLFMFQDQLRKMNNYSMITLEIILPNQNPKDNFKKLLTSTVNAKPLMKVGHPFYL